MKAVQFSRLSVIGLIALLALATNVNTFPVSASTEFLNIFSSCGPDSNSGPRADPCTITATQLDSQTVQYRIDRPVVDRSQYEYRSIAIHAGDTITLDASGCVQTGGVGKTWKRYVNPSGDNSDRLYFGSLSIPGFLTPQRLSAVLGQNLVVPNGTPDTYIVLHYADDDYPDNGYYDHDDGTENQCSFANGNDGGPAHVTITVHSAVPLPPLPVRPRPSGPPPALGQPWDLIPNLGDGQNAQFDDNLMFFNSRWQWQEPSQPMPAFSESKTSQSISFDDAPGYKSAICSLGGGPRTGHANWFDVTYQGRIFWQHHDSGLFGDDDYNILLETPSIRDAGPSDFLAGVAADNDRSASDPGPSPGPGPKLVKGEFDSDETVDFDEFDLIPWWRNFHDKVDEGDDAAQSLIKGHTAIVVGLAGLDLAHATQSELHPVHVLAIRQTDSASTSNDAWSIFVRNWGNEGYCSADQHYLDLQDITIRLPRPNGVAPNAQAKLLSLTKFVGHNTPQVGPDVFTAPNQDTLVTFHLPKGTDEGFVVGELHLTWPGATTQAAVTQAAVTQAIDDDGETGEPEWRLEQAWKALTPAQQQEYVSRLQALAPPPPSGTTVALEAVLVDTPPPLATTTSTVSTGPATRSAARDFARLSALCQTVKGNVPDPLPDDTCVGVMPTLTVPGPITAEATSPSGAAVTFSVSAVNPDGSPPNVSCIPSSGSTFPLGTTTVTCTALDAHGNTASDSFPITVVDTTPPSLSITVSPTSIWPPNHKLVTVTLTKNVSDRVDPHPQTSCTATANEPVSPSDIFWTANGGLQLRAERLGSGHGRVYTISCTAKDFSGNVSPASVATVTVPHDQGHRRAGSGNGSIVARHFRGKKGEKGTLP